MLDIWTLGFFFTFFQNVFVVALLMSFTFYRNLAIKYNKNPYYYATIGMLSYGIGYIGALLFSMTYDNTDWTFVNFMIYIRRNFYLNVVGVLMNLMVYFYLKYRLENFDGMIREDILDEDLIN